MDPRIEEVIRKNIELKQSMLQDRSLLEQIQSAADLIVAAFREDRKLLLCGNGGSAADAQHIAAELSGRFYLDRKPFFAEALHVNSSFVTAVANDFGFEEVFARMLRASGREGDLLLAISTSGNSANILRAAEAGRSQKMKVIGLSGEGGGQLQALCDLCICIPSRDTPRIQEAHILVGHLLCELAESALS